MASEKDIELLGQLIEATKQGRISWEPTANLDEFTTSLRGKFSVVVSKVGTDYYLLRMLDESDREMVRLDRRAYLAPKDADHPFGRQIELDELFELARRSALNVDKAIDDVLQELRG